MALAAHRQDTPVTAYADAHQLTVDQRLRLFRVICEATEHAHHALVVHRDLKPANAAPEQIRAERVTTATDDYVLGAVLYEVLSGERAARQEPDWGTSHGRPLLATFPLTRFPINRATRAARWAQFMEAGLFAADDPDFPIP